ASAWLSPAELERKAAMVRCYRSQVEVLSSFPKSPERFRLAPDYDFTRPPHPGILHYESLGWMPGTEWRRLASLALEEVEWMGPR
ncbi:MAG: hypothetical protein KA760_16275, partial [Steroidobacteraceae bacterium]|nr:hypothetical protein [Steroidobacteraceae bacterium]